MLRFSEIPEYPDYLVSRDGEVYSTKVNRKLKVYKNPKGYKYILISTETGIKSLLLSRVLCRVYKNLPSLSSKLEVDHEDRNVSNNDLDNLCVLTREEHLLKTLKDRGHSRRVDRYCQCGKKIQTQNITGNCQECHKKARRSTADGADLETIKYWVKKHSWSRASRELGLSDNGLRKRYKNLGGDIKAIKQ